MEKPTPIEDNERLTHLIPTVFIHDINHPEITDKMAEEFHLIEQTRYPEGEAFSKDVFLEALLNTAHTVENEGKTNTAVILQDPLDDSIFGFTFATPAEKTYIRDEDEAFYPERLQNPDIQKTAYIYDTVFRQSGSGNLKKIMSVLESELVKKGYLFLERDATLNNNFADNIIKNNKDRIVENYEHDSEYGPQMFIRMKL